MNIDSSYSRTSWMVKLLIFCFIPIFLNLLFLILDINKNINNYNSCVFSHKSIASEDVILCCMPSNLYQIIQNNRRIFNLFPDAMPLILNTIHSGAAFFIFLFLTPSMFISYGIFTKNNYFSRIGIKTLYISYLIIVIIFLYNIATFKDS